MEMLPGECEAEQGPEMDGELSFAGSTAAFWRLAVSPQWVEATCAPPRCREEDGAFAAVCSWELTVPGKLPNLRLMDEPLSEPENRSGKQSGAL